MFPNNKTQTPGRSPTSNASSPTITSLSPQQGSQWGPDGIGTLVFGCVASILGILALWMMYWLGQREPDRATRSDEEAGSRHSQIDPAPFNDDDVALVEYPPHGGDGDSEATERRREDAEVDTHA